MGRVIGTGRRGSGRFCRAGAGFEGMYMKLSTAVLCGITIKIKVGQLNKYEK